MLPVATLHSPFWTENYFGKAINLKLLPFQLLQLLNAYSLNSNEIIPFDFCPGNIKYTAWFSVRRDIAAFVVNF